MNTRLTSILALAAAILGFSAQLSSGSTVFTGTFEITSSDFVNLVVGDTFSLTITIGDGPDTRANPEQGNHDAIVSFSMSKTGGSGTWSGFSSTGGDSPYQVLAQDNHPTLGDFVWLYPSLSSAPDLTFDNFGSTETLAVDFVRLILRDPDTSSLAYTVDSGELLSGVLNRPLDQFSTKEVTIQSEDIFDPFDPHSIPVGGSASGTMTLAAVPEPSSFALMVGAVAAFGLRRRRS